MLYLFVSNIYLQENGLDLRAVTELVLGEPAIGTNPPAKKVLYTTLISVLYYVFNAKDKLSRKSRQSLKQNGICFVRPLTIPV